MSQSFLSWHLPTHSVRLVSAVLLVAALIAALQFVSRGSPAEAQTPTASVLPVPPVGGMTIGQTGTTDISAFIAAQSFAVQSVWKFDVVAQVWLSYLPGAPSFLNNLVLTSVSDTVAVIRGPGPKITTSAPTPAAPPPLTEAIACTVQQAAQEVIASTLKVLVGGKEAGTAFYVGSSQFITAAHVVEGSTSVRLEAVGVSLVADVVGIDTASDVAVLRAATASVQPLEWGDASSLSVGQTILVVGYPGGFGLSASVTSGLVSRTPFLSEGRWLLQTDAAISPGNSGGPVVDVCGRVVGVVSFKLVGDAVEGLGFAIAESSVRPAVLVLVADPAPVAPTPTFVFATATPAPFVKPGAFVVVSATLFEDVNAVRGVSVDLKNVSEISINDWIEVLICLFDADGRNLPEQNEFLYPNCLRAKVSSLDLAPDATGTWIWNLNNFPRAACVSVYPWASKYVFDGGSTGWGSTIPLPSEVRCLQ